MPPHTHDHSNDGSSTHASDGETTHIHRYAVLGREGSRELDRLATEQYGIPSLILMENAGRSIAEYAAEIAFADEKIKPTVLVMAGPGNNGGDGFVTARHLANIGAQVGVVISREEGAYSGDAAANLGILKKMGVPVRVFNPEKPRAFLALLPAPLSKPRLILDALLGTGFEGEMREPIGGMIRLCNEMGDAGSLILAVDVPSGLDAETGEAGEACVEADGTICLGAFKMGALTESGRPYCGELVAGDIGAPMELVHRLAEMVEIECGHDHGEDEAFEEPQKKHT